MNTTKPKIKYKTFTYQTGLKWTGSRKGLLRSDGKPAIVVSSPPEFKGEPGIWTPEDLFIASVEVCTMTTFLAFARHKELPVVSYESSAHGILEFVEGKYRVTQITLRPTIIIENEDIAEQVEKVLHDAHKNCIISNSINTEVLVRGNIITQKNSVLNPHQ